jgi:hypothetical protein
VAALGTAAWLSACSGDIGSGKGNASGGSGGSAQGGSAGAAGDGGVEVPPLEPAAGGIRRLTGRQYVNSIRLLLGETAALAAKPPPDAQDHGFETIGASKFAFSDQQVADLEDSARLVAKAVVTDLGALATLVPCTPTGPSDAACHQQFVESFGKLAWRRPLTQEEITEVTAVAQTAATHPDINDFNTGIEYAISALLQSPNFIYIIELGEPDPENPGGLRLTGWEVAARMSFFLLERTPDSSTLNIVQNTGLDSNEEVGSLAKTMLLKPEAKAALSSFYSELFRLRELPDVAKDPAVYPKYSQALAASMQEETLRLLEDVIWTRNADARELFDADYTFVDAELAAVYGVTPPASGWTKMTLPAQQNRAGLFGHASLLTRFAHPATTSPTKRGLFIRSVMLCDEVDPPPPGVITELPLDDGTPKTMKQKLAQHQADPSCASCHASIDPIGFALDTFDGIGEYRTTDKGLTIDPTASVEDIGDFSSARELGALIKADPRAPRCLMLNLYRNSMGHLETATEEQALIDLDQAFATKSYRIQDLLVEIVKHPAFRRVGAPK